MGAADIYLPQLDEGSDSHLDPTTDPGKSNKHTGACAASRKMVAHEGSDSHLDPTTDPGKSNKHTGACAASRKMVAHAEACRAVGVLFVPLVVESVGRWSDEAIHTIASIGRLQGQCLGIPPSAVSWYSPVREYTTPLPAIGHLTMERECHTVDPPPASPLCQRGRTDLADLVTLIYLFIFLFLLFI